MLTQPIRKATSEAFLVYSHHLRFGVVGINVSQFALTHVNARSEIVAIFSSYADVRELTKQTNYALER